MLAILPQTSFAIQLNDCARSIDSHHFGESGHFDAGDGIVVFITWASTPIGSAENYVFSDCSTGQHFRIFAYQTKVTDDGREVINYDDRASLSAKIDEMVGSENSYKFWELGNEFQVSDKRVSFDETTEENCACRSLYPDLLNKKQRFKMEPWNE
ncbi:MAG: hypothetical protein AAF496_12825 [Pseudomonadota bacterium]